MRPASPCALHRERPRSPAMRTVNSFIGSPVERLEDLRFLRGRGQFVDDVPSHERAARRDPAQLRRARPHPRDRCIGRAEDARRARGHHRRLTSAKSRSSPCGRSCCRSSSRSSSRLSPTTRCATSASRSPWWWPTARRWPRMRWRRSRSTSRRCRRSPTATPRAPTQACCSRKAASNHVITLSASRATPKPRSSDAPYVRRERFEVQRFTAVTMETRGLLAEWDAAQAAI